MKALTVKIILIALIINACGKEEQKGVDKDKNIEAEKTSVNERQSIVEIIESNEFKNSINDKKVNLVDLRTSDKYLLGHIEGAKNIDFTLISFLRKVNELDKTIPTFIYCEEGEMSRNASSMLKDEGFTEIYILRGGINEWENNEYELAF